MKNRKIMDKEIEKRLSKALLGQQPAPSFDPLLYRLPVGFVNMVNKDSQTNEIIKSVSESKSVRKLQLKLYK